MTIEDLPPYVKHDFILDDGEVVEKTCFLAFNRDINGNWSCGYITWDGREGMAIPQLVTNNSVSLGEAAIRMNAKVNRYLHE